LGGGASIIQQGMENGFDNINWMDVGISTLIGGVTGAFTGGAGGAIAGRIAATTVGKTIGAAAARVGTAVASAGKSIGAAARSIISSEAKMAKLMSTFMAMPTKVAPTTTFSGTKGSALRATLNNTRRVKAENFLRANKISDDKIEGIMASFKGIPRVNVLKSNKTVFRVWGEGSEKVGNWISPVNYGANARNKLALPPWNKANNVYQFTLSKGTVVLKGRAAKLNIGDYSVPGGGIQWWMAI